MPARDPNAVLSPPPAAQEADALRRELRELPVQHLVAARLLSMLDTDPSAEELGRVIATDPALSSQVIRLANSAAYGLRSPVANAARATVMVGVVTVRTLALAASLEVVNERGRSSPEGYWTHSVRAAAGAMVVAQRIGVNPADAFSAGLLHDIGAALLFRHAPVRFDVAVRRAQQDPASLLAIEHDELHLTHTEVGADVLDAWRFPAEFVEAIGHHHEPARRDLAPLTLTVVAGEALAHELDPSDQPWEPWCDLEETLTVAGLGLVPVDLLLDAARAEVDTLSGLLTGS